jgi:hypothetical protein
MVKQAGVFSNIHTTGYMDCMQDQDRMLSHNIEAILITTFHKGERCSNLNNPLIYHHQNSTVE